MRSYQVDIAAFCSIIASPRPVSLPRASAVGASSIARFRFSNPNLVAVTGSLVSTTSSALSGPAEWPSLKRKIGRASCRERVDQYVELTVVAVSLKQKNKTKIDTGAREK